MSSHIKADYQILIDNASHYILGHAAAAGLSVEQPVWDHGSTDILAKIHTVQIRSGNAVEELRIPHDWLPLDSHDHGRFRTDVEAALARLRAASRPADMLTR